MNRCIFCDVNVKCCTIICCDIAGDETATGGSRSATAMWLFVCQIKMWHALTHLRQSVAGYDVPIVAHISKIIN